MPRKKHLSSLTCCTHPNLTLDCSSHANEAGYRRPTAEQRAIAAGRIRANVYQESNVSWPAPLLLPGDDLSLDPRSPPQSFRSWVRGTHRNEVSRTRNTVYIVGPPNLDTSVAFAESWRHPQSQGIEGGQDVQYVAEYLSACYLGMAVQIMSPDSLRFTSWSTTDTKALKASLKSRASRIGLASRQRTFGIRSRSCPDGVFPAQLNLNDLRDTAIAILPRDAYALLMLVDQDLYEDDGDEFCCGRAYGSSRIAIVSSARYNPVLDELQGVHREHAWPASHCEAYVQGCCGVQASKKKGAAAEEARSTGTALHAALSAFNSSSSPDTPRELWLVSMCRTASHELGHCFGIAHCVYYACVMQSTSCMVEDMRQPPYLCPVDLAKVLRATSVTEKDRYEAILRFCEARQAVSTWRAYGAWLRWILGAMEGNEAQGDQGCTD